MTRAWPQTPWSQAGQVLRFIDASAKLDPDAEEMRQAPSAYMAHAVAEKRFVEAVMFMAHALQRYDAVLWAAQSVVTTRALDRNDPLVSATLRWIDDPHEDSRQTLKTLADQASPLSAEQMLAMAAFAASGPISEPGEQPRLAPADASAKYAAGAVLSAAYATDEPEAVLIQALEIGEAIAGQER